jgi:hypothetical protein
MVNDKPFIRNETYKTFSDRIDEEKFKNMLCDEKGKPAWFHIGENEDGSLFSSQGFSSQPFIDPKLPADKREYNQAKVRLNANLERCIQIETDALILPLRKEAEKIIRMKYRKFNDGD